MYHYVSENIFFIWVITFIWDFFLLFQLISKHFASFKFLHLTRIRRKRFKWIESNVCK